MMNGLRGLRQTAQRRVTADAPGEVTRRRALAFPAAFAGIFLLLSACGGGEREYLPVNGAAPTPQDPGEVITCDANGDGVITLDEKSTC